MKKITFILGFVISTLLPQLLQAQSSQAYFNTSANFYVAGKNGEAEQKVTEGLKRYPGDAKLKALYDKLKKDEQKKNEQKQKEEKEKKEQEKKEQEKKEQEKKDQQKKDQEKKDQEKKDGEKKDQEKKDQQDKGEKDKDKKDEESKKDEQLKKEQAEKEQAEDQKDKKQNDKEVPPDVSKKLQDMKMSEEKARMILDAMKNQEVQYLQQNKRRATKPKDKSKPDW